MERHVVIGTAGHIDHGKTALVKVLTGTDTDRWEEEKRRGITIDLGFAALELGSGISASIVDVPGHEDFVRNMVAGATGIDIALLVVAADEGVMPQTLEHLAILEFLGVPVGVVAITKCDLAEREWLELVEADLADRLEASSVDWTHTVHTSTVTGQGTAELLTVLGAVAADATHRSRDDLFRMPVDRVFSVAGAGTVVTGTTWSGSVGVGQEVLALPGRHKARVRSVEVHGSAVTAALPGRRTALALVGLGRDELGRGHVVVADKAWRESRAVDVELQLMGSARPLTQRSRVRLHLGTAEVIARVTPADREIVPGATGFARLHLERPLVCRWGDRAVIRSYSPVTTIGGCRVADPWPAKRPRRPTSLESKCSADPVQRLEAFVAEAGVRGVAPDDVPVRIGVVPQDVASLAESAAGVTRAFGCLISPTVLMAARDRTLRLLAEYHEKRPLDPGMPRDLLRQALRHDGLADHVLESLGSAGQVGIEGKTARLADHRPALSDDLGEVGAKVLAALEEAGSQGGSQSELQSVLGEAVSRDLLEFFVRRGDVVRVAKERFYRREALDRLLLQILRVVKERGAATPAQLREETGLTRKYLIPVLEWSDGMAFTRREGDTRCLGPASERLFSAVDTG